MRHHQNRRFGLFFAAAVTIALFVAGEGFAQMHGRGHGRMTGAPYYNTGTEVMVIGTIDDVQQMTGQAKSTVGQSRTCPSAWTGTHLILKTDTGTLPVHVGPSGYVASKNFTFAKGDKLKVLGSRVQYQGSDFLIAREITKGNEVLTLRNSAGFPLWTGVRLGSTPLPGTSGE